MAPSPPPEAPRAEDRTAIVVTLLADDPAARRMVISWPLVDRRKAGPDLIRRWAEVAGVLLTDAVRVADSLRVHGICAADGTVDPAAARFIEHMAANYLRSTGGKR